MRYLSYHLLTLLILFFIPLSAVAQNDSQEEIFKAEIIEVIDEIVVPTETGDMIQQNLKLKALDGTLKNQEIIFTGIGDIQVLSAQAYQLGDKVLVGRSQDISGNNIFYVVDYVRSGAIFWLTTIFILAVLTISRWKGLKSLIALVISFIAILKFIIPQILAGHSPVLISIIGATIILIFSIYLIHGINKKAHLANIAIISSLILTAILSALFTRAARLSGYVGDETIYLIGLGQGNINLQGLLLAGILIGTLGILDDVVVSQISTIKQIKIANPNLSNHQVYTRSLKVGVDHITSMINTLFFAYAGVSLPLLILFTQSDTIGLSAYQIMNNEIIATEIIRTLLGSIGIIMAIPIASYLASYFLTIKEDDQSPSEHSHH